MSWRTCEGRTRGSFPPEESPGGVILGYCHWRGLGILCHPRGPLHGKEDPELVLVGTRPGDAPRAQAWLGGQGQALSGMLKGEGVLWLWEPLR